jgi:hypothetical protein
MTSAQIPRWIGSEFLFAARIAEVIRRAFVVVLRRGGFQRYTHFANRIDFGFNFTYLRSGYPNRNFAHNPILNH